MAVPSAIASLGAPGIFVVPPSPVREITGVRRDVAAFVGVAPRGPARLPAVSLEPDDDVATWMASAPRARSIAVAVSSWDEYRYHFGGFEGPGRLPYAVSTYFTSGGERAYVVRIVHDHGDAPADPAGRASGGLGSLETRGGAPEPIRLYARSEGAWGNRLGATLRFRTRPLDIVDHTVSSLEVARREWVPQGSLLRLDLPGDVRELRYVDSSVIEPDAVGPGDHRRLTLDFAASSVPESVEVVTAELELIDLDLAFARRELLGDIGLRADHPRWLARALVLESTLAWPALEWAAGTVDVVDPSLAPIELVGGGGATTMTGGVDRWDAIVPEDYWDPSWVLGDEVPGDGIHCLVETADVGLLVAPDLYDPQPLPAIDDVSDPPTLCGPDFAPHVPLPEPVVVDPPAPGLAGLRLDPLDPAERARIIAGQAALVAYADARRDLTVLLDVPPGLDHRRALTWRTNFDSPHAAAYHPWLYVAAPDDQRDALVRLNPSAFAAGIIANRELRLGVHFGPANEVAAGAVRPAVTVLADHHDELHVAGINVFLARRDGIELTGARTLSRRTVLRQLSVARLMTVLRLTLQREMQWAVFEPNNRELWAEVRRLVHALLTRLYEAGAFAGASTKEAFFVRCDDTTMTRNDLDNGRLVCLVGVAPVEPVEYLVIEIALAADSGVRVEVSGR